jgi:hypothetical protein
MEWKMLAYFTTIWYNIWLFGKCSLWSFGIFFPLWYFWTKKNLATLAIIRLARMPFSNLVSSECQNLFELTADTGRLQLRKKRKKEILGICPLSGHVGSDVTKPTPYTIDLLLKNKIIHVSD